MKQRDLTKGNIVNNLLYMSVPAMVGYLAQSLYDLVDMMWIGHISAEAVASVTVFSTVFWLITVFNGLIGEGSVPVISQSFGSGDMNRARRAIENTFAFKLLVGIVAGVVLLIIMKPAMAFFSKDPIVLQGAYEYGLIRTLFMPIMFSSFTVTTALRCSGDSKSPMKITLIASLINIILDPIFIFERIPLLGISGLGMGLAGAAWATIIATIISLSMGFWTLFGKNSHIKLDVKGLFIIDRAVALEITRIGTPLAFSGLLRNVANAIILRFVTIYGTLALAAWGVIGRIFGMLFMPVNGLMSGGSAMVGQNIGKNQHERAERTAKTAGFIGLISMCIISALVFIFAPQVIGIFINNPDVIALGAGGIRAALPCLLLMGYYMGIASIFSGTGYTLPFLISSLAGQWALQIPFLYLAACVWQLPFAWIGASYVFYSLGEGSIILYFYLKGKWRKKQTVEANKAA